MKFRHLTLLILFVSAQLMGQNKTIDSLSNLLLDSTDPSEKIALRCKISQRYVEIGDFRQGQIIAETALKEATELGDKMGKGQAFYSLARLNQYMRDWDNALLYQYQAIQLFDEINAIEELAWSYLNMGIAFEAKEEYDRAIRYTTKALEAFKKIKHKQGEAYSYLNLGYPLHEKGETEAALEKLEAAKRICEEINDHTGIGYVHNIKGDIYFQTGNLDQALEENKACIEIRLNENNRRDFAILYGRIGKIYLLKNELKKAEEALRLAEKSSLEIQANLELRDLYLTWSKLDSAQGDFKLAYEHHKSFHSNAEIILKEEREREEVAIKYALNKEIESLEAREAEIIKEYEAKLAECQEAAADNSKELLLFAAAGIILLLTVVVVKQKRRVKS